VVFSGEVPTIVMGCGAADWADAAAATAARLAAVVFMKLRRSIV
jgi:hypothetical protein